MSVLTATNSTSAMPASIIRLTAFRPAPPTPTTRMTARYAPGSARGPRWSLGAGSGSASTRGSSSTGRRSGREPRSGASSFAGEPPGSPETPSTGPLTRTGRSAAGSNGGACSSVSSSGSASVALACGSSPAGASSGRGALWRCAASVARRSSASGPSRMLARFRAIENLLRQVAVGVRGLAARVVLQDRSALHRRLGVADRLLDPGLEHELAEVLLEDLDRLAGVQRTAIEHRRQDAHDRDVRVQVLADHRQRVLELDEPAQREVLALDRDDHMVGRDESVDGQQPERGWSVDEDVVVLGLHRDERLLERALATDHAREGELSSGQVDRRHGQVDLGVLDHILDRQPMYEDVEHRALD